MEFGVFAYDAASGGTSKSVRTQRRQRVKLIALLAMVGSTRRRRADGDRLRAAACGS